MESDYPYKNIINNVIVSFKEVKFPDKNYSKLVTSDGRVAVLFSPGYGSEWSANTFSIVEKHQLTFDSRIVMKVISPEFKKTFSERQETSESKRKFNEFINPILSTFSRYDIPSYSAFAQLEVMFIPENTLFRIKEYDGSESVEIFDIEKFFTS
jgi:hypothetical protein